VLSWIAMPRGGANIGVVCKVLKDRYLQKLITYSYFYAHDFDGVEFESEQQYPANHKHCKYEHIINNYNPN
jgi:hypothetical protein